MAGVFINSSQAIYASTSELQDAISQIQQVGAIAPFIQSTNALASWNTNQTGVGSDHNLLNNNNVFLDPITGDLTSANSLSFKSGVLADPVTGSLWLNSSNNHLYHGNTDLETIGGGNVTSTSMPAVGTSLIRYNGTSGNIIEQSSIISGSVNTQFYGSSGPQISALGVQFPDFIAQSYGQVLGFYQSTFNGSDATTGPFLSPPAVILLIERIGNTVTLTFSSGISQPADAASPAPIIITGPLPPFAIPLLSRTGTMSIMTGGISQLGSWVVDTSGVITIRPSLDPTSNFPSPLAGASGFVSGQTLVFQIGN